MVGSGYYTQFATCYLLPTTNYLGVGLLALTTDY